MARFAALFWFSILVVFECASIDSAMAEEIGMYELKKGNLSMKLTNYGARIVSLVLPDKNGKRGDIALGFDTIQGFMNASSPFGATVGRVAPRIAKAQFTLNGIVYKLPANSGNNTIHGGPKGFSQNKLRAPWRQPILYNNESRSSKQGNAGEIVTVKGTPYDFLTARTVGSRINELPKGYDTNYALDGSGSRKLKKAAIVHDEKSGRVMEILTDQLGVQLFTGNNLNVKGKGGFMYKPHGGLCVVTEGFPDSVNHPNFPSQIVSPGKPYKHIMLFKFSTL
ncbi:ALDOSE-1-EPIMERASE [Salix purpurea]|uniref:ALDOSE-1-EPIMERASE n=1 Tax=Salix purpurea TaxID=77065 RepID=A0A9Q0URR8_SALPP|nr:ALDOSE-1-EPIMERASE [Salix purpurea]